MTESEEEPLFKPGIALLKNFTFICNINDEVSLWRGDATLRAYVGDSLGVWLDTEKRLMDQIAIATHARNEVTMPNAFDTATIIARNADALAAYMAMLGGVRYP